MFKFEAYDPRAAQVKIEPKGLRTSGESTTTLISKLHLSEEQLTHIKASYNGHPSHFPRDFCVNPPSDPPHTDQTIAAALLAHYELERDKLADLGLRWKAKWTTTWSTKSGRKKRVLYQCACGTFSGARKSRKEGNTFVSIDDRTSGYDYTGCLAHADITFRESDHAILRISGILSHNKACIDAVLVRRPAVPLHPHVYEVALAQLAEGADLTAIQDRNTAMIDAGTYRDFDSFDSRTANHRYALLSYDSQTLYRQHYRASGISWNESPEFNIHSWLDQQSDAFKSELSSAIFGYRPRTDSHDRFQLLIQTEEMRDAAWKYGHRQQIVMDGTFGFTSSKVLVFITLAMNDEGHGEPLAFMLFSPPPQNRATSAGYDTKILVEVLRDWVAGLGVNSQGESFAPKLAMTDTDSKERGALAKVFPDIRLRICRYHLKQSWNNHLRKRVSGGGRGGGRTKKSGAFEAEGIRRRVKDLHEVILKSSTLSVAQAAVNTLRTELARAADTKNSYASAASGGIVHLAYLDKHWLKPALFDSFSDASRVAAAAELKMDVTSVANTSNALECLNGLLKHKHLGRYKRGGRRIRLDLLVWLLALKILPGIFAERRKQRSHRENLDQRFLLQAGGAALGPRSSITPLSKSSALPAWLCRATEAEICAREKTPNNRDFGAQELVRRGFVGAPTYPLLSATTGRPLKGRIVFSILSSTTIPPPLLGQPWLIQPTRHTVTLRPVLTPTLNTTLAECTCPDFVHRNIACKHIRAALIFFAALPNVPSLPPLPTSAKLAHSSLQEVMLSPLLFDSRPTPSLPLQPSPSPPPLSLLVAPRPLEPTPLVRNLLAAEVETDESSASESDPDSTGEASSEEEEEEADTADFPMATQEANLAAVRDQTQSRLDAASSKARSAIRELMAAVSEGEGSLDLASVAIPLSLADDLRALVLNMGSSALTLPPPLSNPLPPIHPLSTLTTYRPTLGEITNLGRPKAKRGVGLKRAAEAGVLRVERERATKRKNGTTIY
ncbi:hypothetical protein P7C70_g2768, partial [Phenoliferia sp. Uapishka_3]